MKPRSNKRLLISRAHWFWVLDETGPEDGFAFCSSFFSGQHVNTADNKKPGAMIEETHASPLGTSLSITSCCLKAIEEPDTEELAILCSR